MDKQTTDWAPTPPLEGPPLPKLLGIIWPWYRFGVECYLSEIPRVVKVNEKFSATVGLINRSDIARDGWLEIFIDDLGPFDVEHPTLEPGEKWEKTLEGFAFSEAGIHEFCWSIDTFNVDINKAVDKFGLLGYYMHANWMICTHIQAKE